MVRQNRRTIYGVKDLLGIDWNEDICKYHIPFDIINKNNQFYWRCGSSIENSYLNEYDISIDKIYSIYMNYIKSQFIVNRNDNNNMNLCVFSYPCYYNEIQKSIFSDVCCRIGNNNSNNNNQIKSFIIPENLSLGLTYGYENNQSFEMNKEYPIIIADIGNCSISFSLFVYRKV